MALTTPTEQGNSSTPGVFLPQKLATYFGIRTYLVGKKVSATLCKSTLYIHVGVSYAGKKYVIAHEDQNISLSLWVQDPPTTRVTEKIEYCINFE